MTLNQAERIYQQDKNLCKERLRKRKTKMRIVGSIVGVLLSFVGIALLIWASNIPPTVYSSGFSMDNNIVLYICGIASIILACIIFILCWLASLFVKVNYSVANKQLYLNYLRCTDISDCDKEYYKQLLADIRNAELANAMRRSTALTGIAIMYSSRK